MHCLRLPYTLVATTPKSSYANEAKPKLTPHMSVVFPVLLRMGMLAMHPRPALQRRPALISQPLRCAAARLCTTGEPGLQQALQQALANALDREQRKRASLEKEAATATKAEGLGRWATLIVNNLYRIPSDATSVVVEDWEDGGKEVTLSFDLQKGTPHEQAEAAFASARRLRRGTDVIAGLLEESDRTVTSLGEWQTRIEGAVGEPYALEALHQQLTKRAKRLNLKVGDLAPSAGGAPQRGGAKQGVAARTGEVAPEERKGVGGWSGRVFVSPAGVPILVGRNRKENEQLSLKVAKDPDVWMHVRGSPGAHVVLQLSQASAAARAETDEACLQRAADLAVFYSEMRDAGKAVVSVASPKHVVKPSGAPLGAVRIRQEQPALVGVPDNVPEELIALRDEQKRQGWGD